MSNWISVEDKLPENFGTWKEYLITMLYPRSEYEYRVVATARSRIIIRWNTLLSLRASYF